MAEPFIGQIIQVGFNYAPRDWMLCQAQLLSISQYNALFALLGTAFGGNGQTTFGLPDARGRVFLGTGQKPGFSNYVLGQMGGTENTTLLSSNLPPHTHPATFTGAPGTTTASGTLTAMNVTDPTQLATETAGPTSSTVRLGTGFDGSGGGADVRIYAPSNVTGAAVNIAGLTITGGNFTPAGTVTVGPNTGGPLPFSTLQPYQALTTIIAVNGLFPSRN